MKAMFPGDSGFSVTNLKYMKRWYAFYNDGTAIRHQAGDGICILQGDDCDKVIRHQSGDEFDVAIRLQPGDELEMPDIFAVVPWRHHVQIFTKSRSLDRFIANPDYKIKSAVVLSNEGASNIESNITYLPIYYIVFL